jgi:hypothetical protein
MPVEVSVLQSITDSIPGMIFRCSTDREMTFIHGILTDVTA